MTSRTRDNLKDIPEIERCSSRDYEVINAWLASKGLTIKLDKFDPSTAMGMASYLEIKLQWLVKGTQANIKSKNQYFPGVKLPQKAVRFFWNQEHGNIIAQILTKNGDEIFLTIAEKPMDENELQQFAKLVTEAKTVAVAFTGINFPMIDLDHQPDISWLGGMSILDQKKNPYFISQALQQTKFSMNENGATVESGVAISARRGHSFDEKRPLIIDEPFVVVIRRPGIELPIFVGYLDDDCWKTPKV
ncbi:MAG: hypothetical protein WCT18_03140 [Patescibacteria group bacterium]